MSETTTSFGQRFVRLVAVRPLITMAALVFAWCALWQSFTNPGVIASGVLLAVGIEWLNVGPPGVGGIRLIPLIKLIGVIFWDLVLSTIDVAAEVITPGDGTDEAIIAVDLPKESRDHFLLFVIAVTVTPGTAVVDTDPDTGTVYLHLLYADRAEQTADDLRRLAKLAAEALPTKSTETVGASA